MSDELKDAIDLIDSHLTPTVERTIYTAEDVQDLLLDVRQLVDISYKQELESVSA